MSAELVSSVSLSLSFCGCCVLKRRCFFMSPLQIIGLKWLHVVKRWRDARKAVSHCARWSPCVLGGCVVWKYMHLPYGRMFRRHPIGSLCISSLSLITQSLTVVQPLSMWLAVVCHHFLAEPHGCLLDRSLPPTEWSSFLVTSVGLLERIRQWWTNEC